VAWWPCTLYATQDITGVWTGYRLFAVFELPFYPPSSLRIPAPVCRCRHPRLRPSGYPAGWRSWFWTHRAQRGLIVSSATRAYGVQCTSVEDQKPIIPASCGCDSLLVYLLWPLRVCVSHCIQLDAGACLLVLCWLLRIAFVFTVRSLSCGSCFLCMYNVAFALARSSLNAASLS
jgi:hypothetical protein